MALDIFKLSGTVDVNTGKAETNLKRVDSSAKQTQSALNKTGDAAKRAGGDFDRAASSAGNLSGKMGAMRSASGALGNAFAGLGTELLSGALSKLTSGFSAVIKTGLDFNKQMEAAQLVFTNLTGSADNAVKHLQGLKDFAKSSPFDLPDLIQASSRMQAFGFSSEEVLPKLKNLQNAAALAAGTSGNFTEALGGIVNALGQMKAKGSVSAEEMQQLAERGIPAWDLLAKKIGLTVEQTRKLSEQGRLRGPAAVDALLESFGEGKFAGLGEQLSKTVIGKESNLRDALTQQAGEAGKETFDAYRSGLDGAIRAAQSGNALGAAKGLNKVTAANITMGSEIMDALTLTGNQQGKENVGAAFKELGMDAWRGFVEGLKQGNSGIGETVQGWINSAKEALGIKSPSTVFAAIGMQSVEGFNQGVDESIDRSTEGIKRWAKAIEKAGGEEFLKAVEAMAKRLKIDPNKLMNVMAFESGINPGSKNPYSSATGLIQFMSATAEGLGTTVAKLKSMDAIEQLKYVEEYFKQFAHLADSQEALYAAVLAGRSVSDPNAVLFSKGGKRTGRAYTANAALDTDKSGAITAAEATVKVLEQGFLKPLETIAISVGSLPAFTLARSGGAASLPSASMPGGFMESVLSVDATLHDLGASMATLTTDGAKLTPAITKTASSARDWRKEIVDLGDTTKKAIDHFADLKDAIADGIDNLIMDLVEGGRSITDTLKRFASDFFRGLLNGVFSSISGGKAGSPGQFFGNMLGGLFKPSAAASGGGAGGGGSIASVAAASAGFPGISTSGGGLSLPGLLTGDRAMQGASASPLGGLLSKIPGLGGLFGGGSAGAAAKSAGFPGVSVGKAAGGFNFAGLGAGALTMGGGILGSMAGGKSGIGRLLGGIGGSLLGGAAAASGIFGGSMAAMMPAFFSNPITAIIGGALIGGALLSRLFGNKTLKSLRGLIRGEYGIEVKSDQVLGNIKAMGESKFGKAFKSKQIETVRLPDVREMLAEYAERTGQKGNSKLYSIGNLQDAYAPENTFTRRAMGGPLAAGQAAIVGERRPEVFVPNQSGYVYPSVGDFNSAQGGGGGDSRMFEVMVALVDAIQGLRSIPAGHLIERELRGNPDMATRAMVSSFRRRSDASIEARNLVNSR